MATVSTHDASAGRLSPLRARIRQGFSEFFRAEAAGAVVLLAATILALVLANTPLQHAYESFFHTEIGFALGRWEFSLSLLHWVDDALMTLFFFVVGLEIKRELMVGELAQKRKAALPILAALGGMVVPAAIYLAINAGDSGANGWAVPMATDIAFAIGILALLGSRAPTGLRVFLTALAIADDIGAIVVIALFYTANVSMIWLAAVAVLFLVLLAFSRAGVDSPWPYAVVGIALWAAMYASGVHATIAGVLVALTIPSSLQRMESALHPITTFIVLPLFALGNAGVRVVGTDVGAMLTSPVALGIVLGLVLGKPLGIVSMTWLAVRFRVADLPAGMNWHHVLGAGVLGGIGFTVSLFVANLAFTDAAHSAPAKAAILTASVIAGLAGYAMLRYGGTSSRVR